MSEAAHLLDIAMLPAVRPLYIAVPGAMYSVEIAMFEAENPPGTATSGHHGWQFTARMRAYCSARRANALDLGVSGATHT